MKSRLPKTARACLLALGALALCSGTADAQTVTISNLFRISTADGRPYLTNANATSYTERGAAYNPVNNHAYIVSRSATPAAGVKVAILDGDTGAELGFLNVSGITGGTFALSAAGRGLRPGSRCRLRPRSKLCPRCARSAPPAHAPPAPMTYRARDRRRGRA